MSFLDQSGHRIVCKEEFEQFEAPWNLLAAI